MIKKKMMDNNELFRAVVNIQSAVKSELLSEIGKLKNETEKGFKEVNSRVGNLEKEMKKGFKEVNRRCDLLGKQLNALDEDAPTGEDFTNLVKRVDRLEKYQNFATA